MALFGSISESIKRGSKIRNNNKNWWFEEIPFNTDNSSTDGVPITSAEDVENTSNQINYNEATFLDYLNNLYSGNLDYNRILELSNIQQNFNKNEALANRLWQEQMSNTAYQRQAQDLKLAGYNPALVLGSGGASTPSGSSAYITAQPYTPAGSQMTDLVKSISSNLINAFTSAFKQNNWSNTTLINTILKGLVNNK